VAKAIEEDASDESDEEDPADKYEVEGGRVGIGRDDCYKVEKTGAVVTRESAIPLLHQYCAKIPHDAYSTSWAPIFELSRTLGPTFWCTIRLPGHPWFGQVSSRFCMRPNPSPNPSPNPNPTLNPDLSPNPGVSCEIRDKAQVVRKSAQLSPRPSSGGRGVRCCRRRCWAAAR